MVFRDKDAPVTELELMGEKRIRYFDARAKLPENLSPEGKAQKERERISKLQTRTLREWKASFRNYIEYPLEDFNFKDESNAYLREVYDDGRPLREVVSVPSESVSAENAKIEEESSKFTDWLIIHKPDVVKEMIEDANFRMFKVGRDVKASEGDSLLSQFLQFAGYDSVAQILEKGEPGYDAHSKEIAARNYLLWLSAGKGHAERESLITEMADAILARSTIRETSSEVGGNKKKTKFEKSEARKAQNQTSEKTEKRTKLWTEALLKHLDTGSKIEDKDLSEEWRRYLKEYHGVDDEVSFKKNLSREKFRSPNEDSEFNSRLINEFVFWREQNARPVKEIVPKTPEKTVEVAKKEEPKPIEKIVAVPEKKIEVRGLPILVFLDKNRLEKQTEGNGKEGERVKVSIERFVKAWKRPGGITKITLGVDGKKLSAIIVRIDNGDTLTIPIHTFREVFLGLHPLTDKEVKNPKADANGTVIGLKTGMRKESPYIFAGTTVEMIKEVFERIRIDGKKMETEGQTQVEYSKTPFQYRTLQG